VITLGKTVYTENFYALQRADSYSSAKKILPIVQDYVSYNSVIDIGCGVGTWLRACRELTQGDLCGVDGAYVNVDQIEIPEDCFHPWDISTPLEILDRKFDLTISVEVAEHIDRSKVDIYIYNITRFSDIILFSAAIPYQAGIHHVNEQWPSYWTAKFAGAGYIPVDCLRGRIWNDREIEVHYRQNIMFYVRETALNRYPALQDEIGKGKSVVMDLVHPELYTLSGAGLKKWRTRFMHLLGCLPSAFKKTFKKRFFRKS